MQTQTARWIDRKQAHAFPAHFTPPDTKVNLNRSNGEATSLWKIRIVFGLPAWGRATVTAFILPIKLGEFECDARGLRLAREEGDGAQCAQALPAVPASEAHYVWVSQLHGGKLCCVSPRVRVRWCVRVCVIGVCLLTMTKKSHFPWLVAHKVGNSEKVCHSTVALKVFLGKSRQMYIYKCKISVWNFVQSRVTVLLLCHSLVN